MTTDTPHERRFLVYTIADAIEKLLRIDRILKFHSQKSALEYGGVVRILQASIDHFRALLFDNADLIRKLLKAEPLEEYETIALITIHQNLVRALYGIHERLVFLPRERVQQEVFFCLKDLFGEEWRNGEGSVILTTIYNAHEYRLVDVLKDNEVLEEKLPTIDKLQPFSPDTSVLELPIINRADPLIWPLLAHEFGHTLDRRYSITKHVLHKINEDLKVSSEVSEVFGNWFAEVLADFVAGTVLGPVALLPLFSLEVSLSTILDGPSPLTGTHPPTTFRFARLREYLTSALGLSLEPFEPLISIYQNDQDRRISELDSKSKTTKSSEDDLLRRVFDMLKNDLRSSIESIVSSPVKKSDLDKVSELKQRLAEGIPIASFRAVGDRQISSSLSSCRSEGSTRERTYSALAELNETPCTTAQILSAGWAFKLESYEERLRLAFESDKPDLSIYDEFLHGLDRLLLKSIQLSSVHRALLAAPPTRTEVQS